MSKKLDVKLDVQFERELLAVVFGWALKKGIANNPDLVHEYLLQIVRDSERAMNKVNDLRKARENG